jgi:hypothetical protein
MGPKLLAGGGIEAAEDVELVVQLTVGDENHFARGGDTADPFVGESRSPDDRRLVGQTIGKRRGEGVAVGAAPGGPVRGGGRSDEGDLDRLKGLTPPARR